MVIKMLIWGGHTWGLMLRKEKSGRKNASGYHTGTILKTMRFETVFRKKKKKVETRDVSEWIEKRALLR